MTEYLSGLLPSILTTRNIALLWIVVFAIERISEFLNLRSATRPLGKDLQAFQNESAHAKALDYLRDRTRLAWIRETLLLALFLGMLIYGLYGLLGAYAYSIYPPTRNPWTAYGPTLVFAVLTSIPAAVLSLPFDVVSTFKIEAKHGFNRTTPKTFILDRLKGLILSGILMAAIGAILFTALSLFGKKAWLFAWVAFIGLQFFLVWLAPKLILPLFLKLSPLPEGELKAGIEAYAKKENFSLDGVFVCDASKRSAKTNAFFTGIGSSRRLVLFDTLIEKHPVEEILAVVAHEAGHFKLGHIWKNVWVSGISSGLFLYLLQTLSFEIPTFDAFKDPLPHIGVGFVLASMILMKLAFFTSALAAGMSRKFEYEADAFAIATTGKREPMISALKRLGTDNLSIVNPHPFWVWLHASHPPLPLRVKAIREL